MKPKIVFFTLLTIACVCIFHACNKLENTDAVRPLSKASGEELFMAIYFAQGDAANHIQSIRNRSDEYKAMIKTNPKLKKFSEEFTGEIILKIKELDSAYFTQFKKQLASNNFYSKQLALANGAKMLKAAGYRSSYAGLFKLQDDIQAKNVDFNAKELQSLDYTKKEDIDKFKKILNEEYAINLDDEDYKIACVPAVAFCYAIAAAVSIAAVAYTAFGAVQAVAYLAYWVYAEVKFWSGNMNMENIGQSDALIQELSHLL